jgi:hypothetical protein
VAAAFAGTGHGVHDDVPHPSVLVLAMHAPLHRCAFELQVKPQVPLAHVEVAFGTVGHGVQLVPHVAALVSAAQTEPHT